MNYTALITAFSILFSLNMIEASVNESRDLSCLENGDIIFYEGADGEDFSESIKNSTSTISTAIRITHVGIISRIGDDVYVIEATEPGGVKKTGIDEFLSTAKKQEGSYKILLKRLENSDKAMIDTAIKAAESHIGKEYDDEFDEKNDKYYCSELIRAVYKDEAGNPIFEAKPMSFKNRATGEFDSFWVDHFKKINKAIPEGALGTNPYDLSRSELLVTVNHDCIYNHVKHQ